MPKPALLWPSAVCILALGLAATVQAAPPLAGELTFLDDPIDGDCALVGALLLGPNDKAQFVLNYQDEGSYYLLDIAGPTACFQRVSGGQVSAIGAPGELAARSTDAAHRFVISRRNYRLTFAYGGVVICRGWDGSLSAGKAGYTTAGAVVSDPYLQPMDKIQAADDFVREQDAQHMWTVLSGAWRNESLRDDEQADEMEADKSANAFSYFATSDGPAVTVAEKDSWYWDNYHIGASARSLGEGAMGVVLHAQDAENYLVFRWSSAWAADAQGDRAQMVEVVGGKPKVLAEKPGGFIPDRWYRLDAATCDGSIVCSVDDLPVLRAHSARFGLGNAGLYSEGQAGSYFDDVLVEDYEVFEEGFADLTRWQPMRGDWSLAGEGQVKPSGEGLLASGRYEWDNYLAECQVTADRGGVGLVVARHPDGRAAVLRLGLAGSPYAGKAQIVQLSPEGEKVLAEVEARPAGGKPHQLRAEVEGSFVRGYVDGRPLLEADDPNGKGGAIGLYADGADGARFGAVAVRFLRPKQPAHVVREFSDVSEHPEMKDWASTRAPWIEPPTVEPGAVWWTKGDYFGDATVTFRVRFIGLRNGTIRVVLNGSPDNPQAGVHLVLTATKDSRLLRAQVLEGAKTVGEGERELAGSACLVELSRRGRAVTVSFDDQPVVVGDLGGTR